MILQSCWSSSSLVFCCEEAREGNGERAARRGGEKFVTEGQQLQEFRVSVSSAALFGHLSGCSLFLVLLFLRSTVSSVASVIGSSGVVEAVGLKRGFLLLQSLFGLIWRVSVFIPGTRLPQFFLDTGNVTMDDTKSVHAAGPPAETSGSEISLDSGAVYISVVGKEAGKECAPTVDSSNVKASTVGFTASLSPSIAEQPSTREASSKRDENDQVARVDGSTLDATNEQDTVGGGKDLVVESTPLDGPRVELPSDVGIGGESAAISSSDQPLEQKVDSQSRTDEVKERIELGNSQSTDGLKNEELIEAENLADGPVKGERDEVTTPSEPSLMAVLEKLVSLDPTEVFKDPVDDSFAPNYSKIIKTPMCFSMMQEKIGLQQYPSWSLFVEDFERICYNAMKYNQKRSRIWNAASLLLRQGKKAIEPYIEQGDSMLGLSFAVEGAPQTEAQDVAKNVGPDATKNAVQDPIKNEVQEKAEGGAQDPTKAVIPNAKEKVTQVATGTASKLVEDTVVTSHQGRKVVPKPACEMAEVIAVAVAPAVLDLKSSQGGGKNGLAMPVDVVEQVVTVAPAVVDSLRLQSAERPLNQSRKAGMALATRANHVDEEVKVEILESTGSEDVRPDSRDEATECSSSFGYTQSKVESDPEADEFQQNAEVESELRDGNGALSSAYAEDDELGGGNERGKKALNAEWKKYRRGIEWRCRWLEIRLNELRARSERYDRLLAERRARKSWVANVQPGEESSARSTQMVDSPERGRVLRRMRRNQVENTVDLDLYMARHPLFSRYGTYGESKYKKKKRENEDTFMDAKIDAFQHVQNQQNLGVEPEKRVLDESDTEEQLVVGRSSLGGQDSMEKILWKVEALQARVEKAKAQLQKGAPPKTVPQPLTIPKPPSNLSRTASQASPSPRILPPGSVPRPPGTKGRPPSGQSPGLSGTPTANGAPQRYGSGLLRRKSSDYDINNMVMPVSVGAKYVEHIKHADISTPNWRLIDNTAAADQSTGGSSSDEDTDDEKCEIRHSEMEVNERKHRYMLPPKRSPDGDVAGSGKGRSKSGMGKGAGKMSGRGSVPTKVVAVPTVESPPDSGSSPAFAGSIPKGKRRKRLFNATAFTTNRANRLTSHLGEHSGSLRSPEGAKESMHIDDTVEIRTAEETSTELTTTELEKSSVQPPQSVDQADPKRKRSAGSGLQVLANP
ncbi:unnamed protein product [Calypogeia fissa]